MKRGHSALIFLVCAIVLSLGLGSVSVHAQAADCSFVPTASLCPSGWATIGWATIDGHFANDSSAPLKICCDGLQPGTGLVSFNYSNEGHVSFNSPVTAFPNELRMGFTQPSCRVKSGSCANGLGEICIFRVTDVLSTRVDNSHIADCSSGKLDETFCCRRTEVCNNGIDDDDDNFIDCADEDCHNDWGTPMVCTGSPLTSDVCVQVTRTFGGVPPPTTTYNASCLGQTPPSGVPGLPNYYYCSYAESGPMTGQGACCQSGKKATYNIALGTWSCIDSAACGLGASYACNKDFDTQFNPWRSQAYNGNPLNWCNSRLPNLYTTDPPISERSTACCLTVNDGTVGYYTDNDNVIIFGTTP